MRILHLHCMKTDARLPVQAAAIERAGSLPPDTLISLRPFDVPVDFSLLPQLQAVVIGGSDWSVFEDIPYFQEFKALLAEIRARKIPMFGICFGAQALAHVFGGKVIRDAERAEYGSIRIKKLHAEDPIFSELPGEFHAQAWHHDRIVELPGDANIMAWSQEESVIQAFAFKEEPIWGVQFHPEHTHETFHELLDTRPAPGADHPIEKIRSTIVPTPRATALLARFLQSALQ